jgi:hypothetical protein
MPCTTQAKNWTYIFSFFTCNSDKVAKDISQNFRIGLAHGKHLSARLLAPILCVSLEKHGCHLQALVKKQFALFKSGLLNDD